MLADLHKHRSVLGVVGMCHCPSVTSICSAYEEFEQLCRHERQFKVFLRHFACSPTHCAWLSKRSRCCRAYPEAFTLRCFAFQPSDEQVEEDKTDKKHLLMFPPASAPAEDGAPRGGILVPSRAPAG